jgi:hypothetical protein
MKHVKILSLYFIFVFFNNAFSQSVDGEWHLNLGKFQLQLKQQKLKDLNLINEKKISDKILRDTLSSILKKSNLPHSVKHQNVSQLRFSQIYQGCLKPNENDYNDTTSIYQYINVADNAFSVGRSVF